MRGLAAATIARLRLREDDLLVDLCCGAAAFDVAILRQRGLRDQIIGVDSSEERLARMPVHPGIRCVRMELATFCELPVQYDKILMVDTLAHLRAPALVFAGLFERLRRGGVLLLVEGRGAGQQRTEEIPVQLRASGFEVEGDSLAPGGADRVVMITAAKPSS